MCSNVEAVLSTLLAHLRTRPNAQQGYPREELYECCFVQPAGCLHTSLQSMIGNVTVVRSSMPSTSSFLTPNSVPGVHERRKAIVPRRQLQLWQSMNMHIDRMETHSDCRGCSRHTVRIRPVAWVPCDRQWECLQRSPLKLVTTRKARRIVY